MPSQLCAHFSHSLDLPTTTAADPTQAADVVGSVRARFSPTALDGELLVAVQPSGALQVGCYEIDCIDDVLTLVSRLLTAVHRMPSATSPIGAKK